MRRATKVEVGQKFHAIGTVTGTPTFAYEVQAVFQSRVDHIAYVRLVQIGDPTQTKSIAVASLLNPRHFVPVPPPERPAQVA